MKHNLILKISLIICVLGILLLFFLADSEPELTTISGINSTKIGKIIKIQGKIITTEKIAKDFYLLTIEGQGSQIQVTCNKEFKSNKTAEITGKVQEYKNQIQIQADRIEVLEKLK